MEGISTNILHDLEWNIPDWPNILTFTHHSFLVDVLPYLATYQKLVICLMLVMPCLILGLTFLQLFMYHLMNPMDLLNELIFLVNIILSFLYTFFSERKIQW